MNLLVLAAPIFVCGAAAGAVATGWVAKWMPFRSPSNARRLANRRTDVELRKLDEEEAKAIRETEQVKMNTENDRIEGELMLERHRVGHRQAMLELESAEAKTLKPDIAVGDALRSRRNELRWTQATLARHAQIPVRRISAAENGDPASIQDVKTLAHELDLILRVEIAKPDRSAKPPAWERDRREREAREAAWAKRNPDPEPVIIDVEPVESGPTYAA